MWHLPLVLPIQQRRLFLSSRQGDAKLLGFVNSEWRALEIAENIGDLLVAEWASRYAAHWSWVLAVWQELKSTHAVAPDGRKEAVGVIAFRSDPFGQPSTDLFVVRKQVVEDGDDGIADKTVLT
jgi:hypothetical protein